MTAMLKPGGRFLLVVPALDSAALIAEAERVTGDNEIVAYAKSGVTSRIRQGVVRFGGVPTKHFVQKELRAALVGLGLKQIRFRRVEYSWASHGITPPPAMRTDPPWDWLVVARKEGRASS